LAKKGDQRMKALLNVQEKLMTKLTIAVERNPYNNTWDVGWRSADGEFTPHFCGYKTKTEAEAMVPDFDRLVEQDLNNFMKQTEAEEREQNKRWPNLRYARARIKKLKDLRKALDAQWKLDALLSMELHAHISWPLPSWKTINSGRAYRK
jgi:hypothetical protein